MKEQIAISNLSYRYSVTNTKGCVQGCLFQHCLSKQKTINNLNALQWTWLNIFDNTALEMLCSH